MKPYKILKPEKFLWHDFVIKASITEKKIIRLPLILIANCPPLPKNIAKEIKVI